MKGKGTMIIGITGTSGSGKSTIAQILAKKLNAKIIDADKIAKELFVKGNIYYEEIQKEFGKNITRKELAKIVYKNKLKREKLNHLTYKYVVEEILNILNNINDKNIILDAPLLYESNLNTKCDKVIGVIANRKTKLQRICTRDTISLDEANARLNIQNDDEFYKLRADYIIQNNGEDLDEEINKILNEL